MKTKLKMCSLIKRICICFHKRNEWRMIFSTWIETKETQKEFMPNHHWILRWACYSPRLTLQRRERERQRESIDDSVLQRVRFFVLFHYNGTCANRVKQVNELHSFFNEDENEYIRKNACESWPIVLVMQKKKKKKHPLTDMKLISIAQPINKIVINRIIRTEADNSDENYYHICSVVSVSCSLALFIARCLDEFWWIDEEE